MFDATKARIQRSREFVTDHKSVITHTATAAVASAVTYKVATRRMDDAYELVGKIMILSKSSFDFIEEKGLETEYQEFVPKFLEKLK